MLGLLALELVDDLDIFTGFFAADDENGNIAVGMVKTDQKCVRVFHFFSTLLALRSSYSALSMRTIPFSPSLK